MYELRRHRRLGRFLAAWLLLWVVAMAWSPSPPPAQAHAQAHVHVHAADAGASAADEDAPCPHEHVAVDVHAGHASGSPSHCPLCTFGAAPPPVLLANATGRKAPSEPPRVRLRPLSFGRIELAPPARGPPVLS
jgi:hypothetical protein